MIKMEFSKHVQRGIPFSELEVGTFFTDENFDFAKNSVFVKLSETGDGAMLTSEGLDLDYIWEEKDRVCPIKRARFIVEEY